MDTDWMEALSELSESDIEHLMRLCEERLRAIREARYRSLLTRTGSA